MINFDDVTKKNKIKEHSPNWPEISDHPYRILIIGGSGTRKKNSLFNLISHQPDIDEIYLYVKDSYEDDKDLHQAKYQLLINKRENKGLTHLDNFKAFIEYSNNMDNFYKIIKECKRKQCKMLIVF